MGGTTTVMSRRLWIAPIAVALACAPGISQDAADWPSYGRDAGGTKYSPLDQINTKNVAKLTPAWTYRTGDPEGTWEETPIVVGGMMYLATKGNRVVALNPETGKELWSFDPKTPQNIVTAHRGVSYWPGDKQHPPRIVVGVSSSASSGRPTRLIELDAKTGKLVPDFGDNGEVNLRAGVADNYPNAIYNVTSPPAIYKNLIIVGPELQETPSKGPSGDPRAFDALTGKLVWRFHTVPQPGEPGNETWGPDGWKDRGGPPAWGGITVDEENGLVFVPTGNPADSYYGGDRPGQNLYANSLIALEAATGKLRWYFQVVHHDIFDLDASAPAALVDATVNGKRVPAVAEFSKNGLLYVLDRLTGKPIWGVEERPVLKSDLPGEQSWPTQPFPVKPPTLSRMSVTREEVSNISPESRAFCLEQFDKAKTFDAFTPFSENEPRISFPSSMGGANWAGVAYDPKLRYIIVNFSNLGQIGQMAKNPPGAPVAYRNALGYTRFWDKDGYPCNQPPWGELAAVDTRTGDIAWRVPLGSYEELEARGMKNTGAPNLGGAIATAGGLAFIGATNDRRFRAFDSRTGKMLWETTLEATANATPITYRGRNGKQYVVIVTGGPGHMRFGPKSNAVVAFALP